MTPEQPSDPPRQRIEIQTGPVAYTDVGEGPCVVAVHGLPGSARDWRWLGAALEPRLRWVRLEMPGFGETPLHTMASARVDRRADFVVQVVEALELDRPILVGHSMGGVVAASAVARYPDRFRALGLLASVGRTPHRSMRQLRIPQRALSVLLRMGLVRRLAAGRMRREFERMGFKGWTTEQHVHSLRCVAAVRFAAHAQNLSRVGVPTLVAWTEDDPFIEPSVSEALAWGVATGPRIAFATGGHNLQKTRAIELADAITAWADQLHPQSGA